MEVKINPVALSKHGLYLFEHCPSAYELCYKKHLKPTQRDTTKPIINKIIRELGTHWLRSKENADWSQDSQRLILKAINKEAISVERQPFFIDKITELTCCYISLLRCLRLREKKISVGETYGSPVPITDSWSFIGAADIFVFEHNHAVIWNMKWTWSLEKLSPDYLFYQAVVHEIVLKQPIAQVGFIVIGPQKLVTYNFGSKQKEETLEKINSIAEKIINNKFVAHPEPLKCLYCEYSSYCKNKVIEGDLSNGYTGKLKT